MLLAPLLSVPAQVAIFLSAAVAALHADQPAHEPRMSWLDNGSIRIGMDLELGGAITWLSKSGDTRNVINSYDLGRQVQMSFYSGPIPFVVAGKHPLETWETLGWNPIQSGDCAGHRSHVQEVKTDGSHFYTKCIPMQWPLDGVPGDCTFESWITLEGTVVHARCRIVNAREDHTQYPARDQELPAIYTNAPWHRIITYKGERPFTGDDLTEIKAHGPPQWTRWTATENWSALVNADSWGLGVINTDTTAFIGGFSGKPGTGGAKDPPCGYLSPTRPEILDHDSDHTYNYDLVLGSVEEIRARALLSQPAGKLPAWEFQRSRLGWSYRNASDKGWRMVNALEVSWDHPDPQLESPPFFVRAAEAGTLVIEAALTSPDGARAELFWSRLDANEFSSERMVAFPVVGNGEMRSYTVAMKGHPEYRGGITRLRLDPPDAARSIRLRSIHFGP